MKLSNPVKLILTFTFMVISIAGFMIKLPSVFRHMDKEMHALFYFLAAAFLNIFFAGKKIMRHGVLFIFLYFFGMAIEYAQEYSNKLLHKKIHGRYDPEDIQWNLKGLLAFSVIWIVYLAVVFIITRIKLQQTARLSKKQ